MNQKLKEEIESRVLKDRYNFYSKEKMGDRQISFAVSHNDAPYSLGSCKEYILDGTQEFIKESGVINKTPILIVIKPENLVKIKSVLHQIESYIGFELTTFEVEKETFVLCTGDKRWSIAPPVLSLYCSLMRLAIYLDSTENIVERILNKQIYSDYNTDNNVYNHKLISLFLNNLKSMEDYFSDDLSVNYIVKEEYPYYIHGLGILEYLHWLNNPEAPKSYYKEFTKMTKKILTNS